MTRRFTLPTVVLASALAFLVGVVLAGRMATLGPAAVRDGDPARAAAGARPLSFADVAAKVNPAVVYIEAATSALTRRADGSQSGRQEAPSHDGDEAAEQAERDSGSGFLLSSDGEILTNHHVVDGADRLMVTLADGRRLPARVLGADPDADLALLKLDGVSGLPTVELGDSSTLRPGEWVCAIGNPLGYEHTVTVGVVSYLGRKLFDEGLDDYIQTDAAIDVGNSGGPLIDASGRVVGINTAISAEGDGIGFAVPINQARDVLDHLRRRGRALRGYMGVSLQGVDADLRRALGLGAVEGVLVEDVSANSPGERAGLRRYDVIESVEGRAVRTPSAVIRDIASRLPGTQVRLRIVRDGRGQELTVSLVERPLRESP
ncbi:MAG TPA: trypsin-like peptidase domain-containing protein, partial [Vicinamibacterales bacterium]|nr:trypsin-like peptidase domain-containing protein [Vicinamibacterales bacterium]